MTVFHKHHSRPKFKFKWSLNSISLIAAIVIAIPVVGDGVIKIVQLWGLPDQVAAMQHQITWLLAHQGQAAVPATPGPNTTLYDSNGAWRSKTQTESPKGANSP